MISEVDPTRSGGGAHIYASKSESASPAQGDAATKIFNGVLSILSQLTGTLEKTIPYLKALDFANQALNAINIFLTEKPSDFTPAQLNTMYKTLYDLKGICDGKEPKISNPLQDNHPKVWKALNEINSNPDVVKLYNDLTTLAQYENSIGMPLPPGQLPTTAQQQQIDTYTKTIEGDIGAIQKATPPQFINNLNELRARVMPNLVFLGGLAFTELKRALSLIQMTSSQITNLTSQESSMETKMVS